MERVRVQMPGISMDQERKHEFGGLAVEKCPEIAGWLATGGLVGYSSWEGFTLDVVWWSFWFAVAVLVLWCYRGHKRGEFTFRGGWREMWF